MSYIVTRYGICRTRFFASAIMAFAATSAPAFAETRVTDASGETVVVTDSSRILSVGGDITEVLYALQIERQVVAVDTTSQFPPKALKEKKSVGYLRALSAEGILSVGATLMLASERAGPPDVIRVLKASSLPVVLLKEGRSAADISNKVRFVGRIVGQEIKAEQLASSIEAKFRQLADLRHSIKEQKRAVFALSVQSGRITVGGRHTSADLLFGFAGLVNAAADLTGYKPVGEEGLINMAPDVLIISKPSGPGAPDASAVRHMSGVRATAAGKNGNIIEMDALYLLGLGPRTPSAARELMSAAYPEIKAP